MEWRMNMLSFLPSCRIVSVERTGSGALQIIVQSRRSGERCPTCGVPSRSVHSRYRRSPSDLPMIGRDVRLSLTVRRFYCQDPSCPRRTFAERFGLALAPFARRTRRRGKALTRIGVTLGGEAGARLAHDLAMPVSGDTLLRLIRSQPVPVAQSPHVVGVDDWALRKGRTAGISSPTPGKWSNAG
ncbi:transposase family protein [Azospirillum doebereinerae]